MSVETVVFGGCKWSLSGDYSLIWWIYFQIAWNFLYQWWQSILCYVKVCWSLYFMVLGNHCLQISYFKYLNTLTFHKQLAYWNSFSLKLIEIEIVEININIINIWFQWQLFTCLNLRSCLSQGQVNISKMIFDSNYDNFMCIWTFPHDIVHWEIFEYVRILSRRESGASKDPMYET